MDLEKRAEDCGSVRELMELYKQTLDYFMGLQVETEHINDEIHIQQDINCLLYTSRYKIFGVTYYMQGDPSILASCLGGIYDEIIIDFGELRPSIRAEWLLSLIHI